MRFGLFKYDRTNNVGDEIQTLSAKRFLPHVDDWIQRDRTYDYNPIEQTRVIFNGWFLHNPEHFHIHPNVEPLFISFHATSGRGLENFAIPFSEMLKDIPGAAEPLRQFAPIGVRDLYTWRLLQDLDIPSYFSGCLTLSMQRPSRARGQDIVLADIPAVVAAKVREDTDRRIISVRHSFNRVRGSAEMFRQAERMLKLYSSAHLVITNRLHVAMPCLAFETPVILVSDHLNDPRFSGLIDLCHHRTVADFLRLPTEWFERPDPNPERYLGLRKELIERVETFVKDGQPASTARAAAVDPTPWAVARELNKRLGQSEFERTLLAERLAALEKERAENAPPDEAGLGGARPGA